MSKKTKSPSPAETGGVQIPTATAANVMVVENIPLKLIKVPKDKKDRTRDDAFWEYVRGLAASMAQSGLINPITVFGETENYAVVAGECRYEAAKLLEWTEIPAYALKDAKEAADVRAAENLQRLDLNDDQKAMVIAELIDREIDKHGDTDVRVLNADRERAIAIVASRIGWTPKNVRRFSFLGELPTEVRTLAAAGRLSLEHCRVLAMVPDDETCISLAKRNAAGEDLAKEPMGALNDLTREVNRELATLSRVIWDKSLAFAGGPACNVCPDNSLNRTGLFDGHGKGWAKNGQIYGTNVDFESAAQAGGVCLKLSCFRAKTTASKSCIRGAGDRIATKLKALKPAQRAEAQRNLEAEAVSRNKFVLPTVFGKQLRERIKARVSASSAKSGAGGVRMTAPKKMSAEATAASKYESALMEWGQAALEAITKAVRAQPRRRELLRIIDRIDGVQDYSARKPTTHKNLQKFRHLAVIVADPNAGSFDALVEYTDKADDLDLYDWSDDAIHIIGTAVAPKMKPRPMLEDFLPKPEAKKPPAKSHAAGKPKPSAKPAGKKKSKKGRSKAATAADVADLHDKLARGEDD